MRPRPVPPRRDLPAPPAGVPFRRAAAAAAAALAVASGCSADAPPVLPPPPPRPPGHVRMIETLREVAERTDRDNAFLGRGPTEAARQALDALPADAPPVARMNAVFRLAENQVRIGEARAAIRTLEAGREVLPRLAPGSYDDAPLEIEFRLGVAWMRLGETANCCRRPSPESCILPIHGGGVHADAEGSRNATERFRVVVRRATPGSVYHLKALWLLNLAAMTLGEWPDGLPLEERMPRPAFDSGVPFPRFENVAAEAGADTTNLAGGAVVDDLDGDGTIDILTSTSDARGPMRFLHGDGKGRFEDRTAASGLEGELGGLNLLSADCDNDGDLDVVVLRGGWFQDEGGRVPSSLLQNDGHGRFTDVTYEAGLGAVAWATQTGAWADYDGDGDLDLYLGHEATDAAPYPCQLFRNGGDGTFLDVAAEAGVANLAFTKSVCWGDFDGDRRPDLYVSNIGGENRLYHNAGDGTFRDVARHLGVSRPEFSFGAFFFDYDDDGALDLYVSAYRGRTGEVAGVAASALGRPPDPGTESQRLYKGDGHGGFRDVTAEAGLDRVTAPMGHNFGDLNDDGRLDFYLGTGYPDYESLMPNVMYLNLDGKRFADVSWAGGFGHLQKGHAIAFADLDGDGDTDVFEEMGGALPGDAFRNALYRNPGFGNHALTVHLVGVRSNRSAIGVRLRAEFVEEGRRRTIHRWVGTGGTFGCNPLRQRLGLGKATRVERLTVFWPTTGVTQTFEGIDADQEIRVTEESGTYEKLPR